MFSDRNRHVFGVSSSHSFSSTSVRLLFAILVLSWQSALLYFSFLQLFTRILYFGVFFYSCSSAKRVNSILYFVLCIFRLVGARSQIFPCSHNGKKDRICLDNKEQSSKRMSRTYSMNNSLYVFHLFVVSLCIFCVLSLAREDKTIATTRLILLPEKQISIEWRYFFLNKQ